MTHLNELERFLELACCPACKEKLVKMENGVVCQSCSKAYRYNSDGILVFSPRSELESANDIYENQSFVEKYAGVYAFGYQVLKCGHMESLHRTVSELILSSSLDKRSNSVLDVGCGVGRATCDCASSFYNTFVVGIDLSERMLRMAQKIVKGKDDTPLDLTAFGFGRKELQGFGLNNAFLIQGNAGCLPFANQTFDMVINVNLLDRVNNPKSTLLSMVSILKPGGKFIFTSPLNWSTSDLWSAYPNEKAILDLFKFNGLKIDIVFDGLIYREAHDIRSYSDWNTLVVRATKVQ